MAALELERESDYYDSAYLADYYESLWTEHQALDDIEVYWAYFMNHVKSQLDRDSPFVFLDVGTGTGRVIHALIEKTGDYMASSRPSIRFIGMDKSPFMLERARDAGSVYPDVDISWFVGTATALQELEPLANSFADVDLLIFAFSGISHLHQPGEVDQFFSSVAQALRPGGLAMVSVCTPLLDLTDGTYVANPYGKVKEVKSKRLEQILYRERETGQKIDGDVFTNSLKTEVVRISPDGSEQIIERNNHDIPLRLLSRAKLHTSIAMAGLELWKEESTTGEVIFVVKKTAN